MKINKLIASLLAVSLLAFPVVQVSADENISLTVNGEKVETQVPPTIIDGRTMVPVRDPLWEEEERLREEYIAVHGERVYDDDF